VKRALLESLTTSWPPSPFRLDQLPWDFLIPSTASLGLAPSGVGCPFPLRFRSQVFATSQRFPSMPELRGLVSCRSHSWDRPFRAFPSQELRTPLGVACSLAVIHRVLGRAARTFSPAVSPTPESFRPRWPGSPSGYELPFLGPRFHPVREGIVVRLLVALGPRRRARPVPRLHLLRSLSFLLRIRSRAT